MDSFELNKVAGALLGTCLFLLALNIMAEAIYAPTEPAKPGYEIEVQKKPAAPAARQPAAPPEESIEQLLAKASVSQGEMIARQCAVCHNFMKGGPNMVGPNLWGIVGRPRASEPGYMYSDAMKMKGGTWTIDELNKFLTNPRDYIPGTKMTFAGLPRGNQRADVIAYLNTLSDHPQPLPVAKQ